MLTRILVIKLGALGDVVRTTPIIKAIKEKYPDSEIVWVTKKEARDILEGNPEIKEVRAVPFETNEKFDVLYNFDIEKEASEIAEKTKADKKYGFYSESDYPAAFNMPAEYYINTVFDDDLKKSNKKTYQEMMFETAELPYMKQKISIYFDNKDKEYAFEFINNNDLSNKKIIGIHLGASSRWPSKAWSEDKVKEFIRKAKAKGYEILLFGGPNEKDKHARVASEMMEEGINIYQNNPENTLKEFAALVNVCNKMVCADSLALHVSLALNKPTVGLFFCTSYNEVEDYGLLKKIISPMHKEFFPERMDEYSEELVNSIGADEVLEALGD